MLGATISMQEPTNVRNPSCRISKDSGYGPVHYELQLLKEATSSHLRNIFVPKSYLLNSMLKNYSTLPGTFTSSDILILFTSMH